MKCDGNDLIIVVEKTADRVTIKNQGQVLYNQAFTDNDANCRQATTQVKTQVWNYDGLLALKVYDNNSPQPGCLNWVPFAVSNQAVISTDFSDQAVERFYVKYPCQDSVWFKLFLRHDAGAKNWWGGEKTDFTMAAGAMKCDGADLIIVVEKTADRVTIKNQGQVLYNQVFTDNDANCRQATTQVKTQVWNYDGELNLAVFDNSATLKNSGNWVP